MCVTYVCALAVEGTCSIVLQQCIAFFALYNASPGSARFQCGKEDTSKMQGKRLSFTWYLSSWPTGSGLSSIICLVWHARLPLTSSIQHCNKTHAGCQCMHVGFCCYIRNCTSMPSFAHRPSIRTSCTHPVILVLLIGSCYRPSLPMFISSCLVVNACQVAAKKRKRREHSSQLQKNLNFFQRSMCETGDCPGELVGHASSRN